MVNISSPAGIASFVVLFICSCAYLRRVPRIRAVIDRETKGPSSIIHKAALVGQRLPNIMTLACLGLAACIVL